LRRRDHGVDGLFVGDINFDGHRHATDVFDLGDYGASTRFLMGCAAFNVT
jgi:hypothetical protein